MHLVDESEAIPLSSIDELIEYFRQAEKPPAAWRVGTEHELIGVLTTGERVGAAPTFAGPDSISQVLAGFAARGWAPVSERGHVIALTRGEDQITIEPGGQFELAARPVSDGHALVELMTSYRAELAEISRPLGLAWLSIGFRPFGTRADVPWMPKHRHEVMRDYMPTVGTLGLDMMLRTATVQTNYDWSDEADAAAKLRALLSVTSILTALYASSPIVDGRPSGYQSYRAHIWRHTDDDRAGILRFGFERDDIYRAYAEWALDVPLYFLHRGGYRPVPAGLTFRQFMHDGHAGERATQADWALHLSTLFPEARMKRYMEVRGCDCGSFPMNTALGPLCRGFLYDADARAAAIALTADLDWDARRALADAVPRTGLATPVGKATVGVLARELVTIAGEGLRRLGATTGDLLDPVRAIADSGRTQADEILDVWHRTGGEPAQTIAALAHPGLDGK